MLSDEGKREYEELKSLLYQGTISQYGKRKLVEIIEKQSKEIEHQKEKRENQKKELAILNAKQIEFNKLVNTVNSYKGQFKRQQKELEELKEDSCCMTTCLRRDKEKLFLEDKIKAKIEEVEQWELYNMKIPRLSTLDERLGAKIGIKYVLQSLLEKE